jgi:hypothetical protein
MLRQSRKRDKLWECWNERMKECDNEIMRQFGNVGMPECGNAGMKECTAGTTTVSHLEISISRVSSVDEPNLSE